MNSTLSLAELVENLPGPIAWPLARTLQLHDEPVAKAILLLHATEDVARLLTALHLAAFLEIRQTNGDSTIDTLIRDALQRPSFGDQRQVLEQLAHWLIRVADKSYPFRTPCGWDIRRQRAMPAVIEFCRKVADDNRAFRKHRVSPIQFLSYSASLRNQIFHYGTDLSFRRASQWATLLEAALAELLFNLNLERAQIVQLQSHGTAASDDRKVHLLRWTGTSARTLTTVALPAITADVHLHKPYLFVEKEGAWLPLWPILHAERNDHHLYYLAGCLGQEPVYLTHFERDRQRRLLSQLDDEQVKLKWKGDLSFLLADSAEGQTDSVEILAFYGQAVQEAADDDAITKDEWNLLNRMQASMGLTDEQRDRVFHDLGYDELLQSYLENGPDEEPFPDLDEPGANNSSDATDSVPSELVTQQIAAKPASGFKLRDHAGIIFYVLIIVVGISFASKVLLFGGSESDQARSSIVQQEPESAVPAARQLPPAAKGLSEESIWVVHTPETLKLRTAPNGSRIALLPGGLRVEYLGDQRFHRHIRVLEGDFEGEEGFVHRCCVKPYGTDDFYMARLSERDHFDLSGEPLTTAAAIIRQDRDNFHVNPNRRDMLDEDRHDERLVDGRRRENLEELLAEHGILPEVEEAVLGGTPKIQVSVWRDRVDVVLLQDDDRDDRSIDLPRQQFRYCLRDLRYETKSWMEAWRICNDQLQTRTPIQKRTSEQLSTCKDAYADCHPGDYPPPLHIISQADCHKAYRTCISQAIFDPWKWEFFAADQL